MVSQSSPGGTDATGALPGDFAALCRDFLAEEYEAAPVMASGLGLTEFDGRLDDLSDEAFEARRRRSAAWQARFRRVPDAG